MDQTEAWLREHDPDYGSASGGWKHVKSGEYKTPRQEVPIGLYHDDVVYVEPLGLRACEECSELFSPREAKHRYCSNACKMRAYRRRK